MMQIISSKDNELIKHIKKLKDKKERDISNEYMIEGIKLVKEAIQEKANIKQIILCDDCEKTENISKELISKNFPEFVENKNKDPLNTKFPNGESKQDVINRLNNIDKEINYTQDIIVALDDVQEPGNLGTILELLIV